MGISIDTVAPLYQVAVIEVILALWSQPTEGRFANRPYNSDDYLFDGNLVLKDFVWIGGEEVYKPARIQGEIFAIFVSDVERLSVQANEFIRHVGASFDRKKSRWDYSKGDGYATGPGMQTSEGLNYFMQIKKLEFAPTRYKN
jgi:hypothetical protein